jgi:single-strand DNA-binding protein
MASRSLNRVVLIGNLTRDPELKYTPQGTAVCSFGVATNRSWTTKTGDTKEDVQFHRIVAWQKLAELSANLLAKGRKIYLEGRITYRSFEGKDGQQKQITEIIMDDFVLFDDRRKGADGEMGEQPHEEMSAAAEPAEHEDVMAEKVDPDDIPF